MRLKRDSTTLSCVPSQLTLCISSRSSFYPLFSRTAPWISSDTLFHVPLTKSLTGPCESALEAVSNRDIYDQCIAGPRKANSRITFKSPKNIEFLNAYLLRLNRIHWEVPTFSRYFESDQYIFTFTPQRSNYPWVVSRLFPFVCSNMVK